jgi:hypothetical protein
MLQALRHHAIGSVAQGQATEVKSTTTDLKSISVEKAGYNEPFGSGDTLVNTIF